MPPPPPTPTPTTTLSRRCSTCLKVPDLFAQKVLQHLDPIDRTFLAQAGSACRAAVAASDLPRAGTSRQVLGMSVWVVKHRLEEFVGSVERLDGAKASGCPWVARICSLAARGGSLEVLQWARQHGCPWDTETCSYAAEKGHLDDCAEVGAGAPLPVERADVFLGRCRRAPGGAAVGAGERLPMEPAHV